MYKSKLLFSLLIICFLFNFSLNLFSTEIKISKNCMVSLLMTVGMMK